MRIAVLGHSMIHVRQHSFWQRVAFSGHDVLLVCPDEWPNNDTPEPQVASLPAGSSWELWPTGSLVDYTKRNTPVFSRFRFVGLEGKLDEFRPDIVYVNQEPGSQLVDQALHYAQQTAVPLAVFTWENIGLTEEAVEQEGEVDLLVCGNKEARLLAEAGPRHPRIAMLPQVGVDVDHFAARPDITRDISVAYVGRPAPEKGIDLLQIAWPTVRALPWVGWRELPWRYSDCKVVVCFSQDTPLWREQAMPYVAAEALSCGALPIVSDAGSIPYWWTEFGDEPCTAVTIVPRDSVTELRDAIQRRLDLSPEERDALAGTGRAWVSRNLGSDVIARRLVKAFGEVIADAR